MNSTTDNAFENFAKGLVPAQKSVDPETLRKAREWYRAFAGAHAVQMTDRDVVEIYQDLT